MANQEEKIRAYQSDLRQRIVEARGAGASGSTVARQFSVAVRTVERYWKSFCATGHYTPKRHGGYRRSRLADHDATLRLWIEQKPDQTLAELVARCTAELGVTISVNALWYRLERLGLSLKKTDSRRRTRPT
ncbi:MAG: IS630 transposase-related protein [Candidatus Methylacidiphilales bacterium]